MSAVAVVSTVLSALVPGTGQLVRRRYVEAILFLVAVLYLRLLLAGLAGGEVPGARLAGFFFGTFGVPGGFGQPTFVVFTVLTIALHALAAWDAGRSPRAASPVVEEPPPRLDASPE